jgi:hypothetical protein
VIGKVGSIFVRQDFEPIAEELLKLPESGKPDAVSPVKPVVPARMLQRIIIGPEADSVVLGLCVFRKFERTRDGTV